MNLRRSVTLWIILYIFWYILSGYHTPLLLTFGAIACTISVWIAHRMDVLDHEGNPIHLTFKIIPYWFWLGGEIIKANFELAKMLLSPKLEISPVMFKMKTELTNELDRVIYANSLTLTPITITVEQEGDELEVHALTVKAAKDILGRDMERRVKNINDGWEG